MTPFDRLGRFVVRRAWWVVGAWAALLLIALPFAPQVPGQLSAGGFILDDLESARAKALLETELGAPPSALVVVFSSPDARGRNAGVRGRRGRRDPRRRHGPARRPRRLAPPVAAPDLRGRPHRLRHRLPRPAARRFARRAADPARAPAAGARARRRAGRRARLLRRRPDRLGSGPAPERDHLAAAGGARPDLRLRFAGRRGRPADRRGSGGHRGAGRHLRRRLDHADEHLRAQPGDAAGSRAGGRLLAADDEPVPRGAGAAAGWAGPGPRCRPGDGRDRRPGGLLQRADRPARAARARPLRVHDPALGRDRRGDRRRARGRVRADAAAGPADDHRRARRPLRRPQGGADAGHGRGVVAPGPSRDAPPGRGPDPDPRAAAPARVAVPARAVQRPRRLDPAARGAVAGRVRPAQGRVRRGRVRTDRPRRPDRRRRDQPGQPGRPVRLLAPARRRPARLPRRQPRRRRPAPDAGAVHVALRRPERAARSVRPDRPRGDDPRRPDGVHAVHAVRPQPRRGQGARHGPAHAGRRARASGRDDGPGRWWRGRRRRRGRSGPGGLPANGAVHHRVDLSRALRPAPVGGPAGQGAGHEHAVDRRQLRGARLDLPGRQPVVGARLPAARVRRDDPAGDPVLRPVRPVDGLRGLPAVADEGGLGPDRRQHRGGRRRDGAERPDRHVGGADRGASSRVRSRSPTSC